MKNLIFLSIVLTVCQITLYGQSPVATSKKEKSFRLKIGGGISYSFANNSLKKYLRENGLGDDYSSFGLFTKTMNEHYPKSEFLPPLGANVTLEYMLDGADAIEISVGFDQQNSVKGYYKYGTETSIFGVTSTGRFVTIEHFPIYLAAQYDLSVEKDRLWIFGGPTIDLHIIRTTWGKRKPIKDTPASLGFLAGIRVKAKTHLEFFGTFRWNSVHLKGSSQGLVGSGNISTLPAKRIILPYIRAGVTYAFDL